MQQNELLKTKCILTVMLMATCLSRAELYGSQPNILLFFPDQHRFDWTSMNPELPDITPNLKTLAARGVCFRNALSPSPVCAPSRACLASGRDYAHCGVNGNGASYPLDQITVYALLRQAGYRVLGCGKFDLDKPGKNWGIHGKHMRAGAVSLLNAWGFTDGIDNAGKMDGVNAYKNHPRRPEPYFAFLENKNLVDAYLENYRILDHNYDGEAVLPDEAYGDNWIARNGLDLIRSVPHGEPWFLQINFNGPHSPMDVTKSMYEKWKDATFPGPRAGNGKNRPGTRRNYAAMINNIDRWVGVFQDELAKRSELENTLIVYCSDHGEMLGDHGLGGKSQPYHASASVPLVIAGPGIRKNVDCSDPVETLDLTATFLDFAGVERPKEMDSVSLRPYMEGRGNLPRPYATSSLKGWSLVFDGRYKLIAGQWKSGTHTDTVSGLVLYDLAEDPAETKNVADQHPDIVMKLRSLLPPLEPYKSKAKKRKAAKDRAEN